MIKNIDKILEILEIQGDNRLKDILSRGIKLEPYQANLLFLKRRYGKTFMSYTLLASDILEYLKENNTAIIGMSSTISKKHIDFNSIFYDPDITSQNIHKSWLFGFKEFINKYYKEFNIIKESQDSITIKKEDK